MKVKDLVSVVALVIVTSFVSTSKSFFTTPSMQPNSSLKVNSIGESLKAALIHTSSRNQIFVKGR